MVPGEFLVKGELLPKLLSAKKENGELLPAASWNLPN
jgi:hypothetical protein